MRGTLGASAARARAQQLRIGALGVFDFPPGWYVYIGSAFGPGGITARVTRHARAAKRLHWHIDYLLEHADIEAITVLRTRERFTTRLCAWCNDKLPTRLCAGASSRQCVDRAWSCS